MGMIVYFVLGYLALCVAVVFFRKSMPLVLLAGYLYAAVLIFDSHEWLWGMAVIMALSFVLVLMRIADGDMQMSSGAKSTPRGGSSSMRWLFYAIPLFWPFLIAKAFLSGKTHQTDMTPYDYEQFKKCNAR